MGLKNFLAKILSTTIKNNVSVVIPINADRSHSIIVATNNYNLNFQVNEGAILIYSTDTQGTTIKGKILVDNDGKIGINNESKNLKSLIDDLITAIINIVTIGSPSSHRLTPSSIAALNQVKSDFSDLLKDI
jgi:hypothetical protein